MIASLVAPILLLGALERFSRWRANRTAPAAGALLTAVALTVMVTLDTPVVIAALGDVFELVEHEVVTIERVLLLVACFGALVFAFALDGRLTRARMTVWGVPLAVVGVSIAAAAASAHGSDVTGLGFGGQFGLALETALVYACLGATALVVALSSWRVSKRTRVHRMQLRILAVGGVLLATVAVANVIAGGVLIQQVQVGEWVLRLNRLMLNAGFAGWTLVLMASWFTTVLITVLEWISFRPAYEQVRELFPDLEAVARPGGGWMETADPARSSSSTAGRCSPAPARASWGTRPRSIGPRRWRGGWTGSRRTARCTPSIWRRRRTGAPRGGRPRSRKGPSTPRRPCWSGCAEPRVSR